MVFFVFSFRFVPPQERVQPLTIGAGLCWGICMRSSSRLGTWSRVAFFAPLVAAVGILLWTCRCRQADGAPPPDRSSACKELYAPLENGILDLLELKAELFFADYDKWGYYITNAATLRTRLNTLQQCPRGVGICATMRQENSYLQEWLAWHILVGVQHFYLRDDNRGREGGRTQSILQPFIDLGYVTIIPSSKLPANGTRSFACRPANSFGAHGDIQR